MKIRDLLAATGTILIFGLLAAVTTYTHWSPEALTIREAIRNLGEKPLAMAELRPYEYCSIVDTPVTLGDPAVLRSLSDALKNLPSKWPNHPKVTRAVTLKLVTQKATFIADLKESSNDGVWLQVHTKLGFIDLAVPSTRRVFDVIDPVGSRRCT